MERPRRKGGVIADAKMARCKIVKKTRTRCPKIRRLFILSPNEWWVVCRLKETNESESQNERNVESPTGKFSASIALFEDTH
jgi:hypothetical protein